MPCARFKRRKGFFLFRVCIDAYVCRVIHISGWRSTGCGMPVCCWRKRDMSGACEGRSSPNIMTLKWSRDVSSILISLKNFLDLRMVDNALRAVNRR